MSQSTCFKETELGEIPEEWEVKRLGEVANIFDHLRIPLSEKQRESMKGEYPYCGANGIIDYINDYIFDGEYVLLAEDGGYWGAFEPSAYIMQGKFWVNNHAHVLQGKDGILLNRFLVYALNFFDLTGYVSGTTRGKLTQTEMKKILIPLPPLEEQKRIAGVLRLVDEIIERTRQIVSLYEKAKKYALSHLLTKGIGHTRFKQTELGEIPEEWKTTRAGEHFDISIGRTPNRNRQEFWDKDGETKNFWATIEDLQERVVITTKERISDIGIKVCKMKPVPKGTVLVSFKLTIGRVSFAGCPLFFNEAIAAFLPKPTCQFDKGFLFYILHRLPQLAYQQNLISPAVKGNTLNKHKLANLILPLPSLEEQKRIAEILSTIDKAIDNERRYLEALGKLKKWLLNNLLTGKVRLPEWVGDILKQVFPEG
ncbi:MAG: restriction endonuclease subunit S [Archaeoglobaceae archaeon]